MYDYLLCLKTGGLMEDPDRHAEDILAVSASNLYEARKKWAEMTQYDKFDNWDKTRQTYWGWKVAVLRSNDPNVDRKEFY